MESQPIAAPDNQAPPVTRYTFSLTGRACLQALQLAAWVEAMVLAHRATQPHGAASWSWFIVRCVLFTLAVYVVVGVAAQVAKRRSAQGTATATPEREQPPFDTQAFEAAANVLMFHVGAPLWMWIFA